MLNSIQGNMNEPNYVFYNNLIKIFGSKLKADEIIYLNNGIKEVVRQLFFEREINDVKKYCMNNSLYIVESKFKIIFVDDDCGSNFSNKGQRVDLKNMQAGAISYYISKDEKKAYLAALYEQERNDAMLGKILGYPECCVDYFLEKFSLDNTNPELSNEDIHEKNNLAMNLRLIDISKRDNDVCIISHFPCNWNCEPSFNIAEKRLVLLNRKFKFRADEISLELSK